MPELKVGDQLPPMQIRFTRENLVRYAGAAGDFNPIHYSDQAANALGLPGVVAHGMLTMGAVSRVITQWLPNLEDLLSYSARFIRPVVVPDDGQGVLIEVTAEVSKIVDGIATIRVDARCAGQKVLGAAKAEVRVE